VGDGRLVRIVNHVTYPMTDGRDCILGSTDHIDINTPECGVTNKDVQVKIDQQKRVTKQKKCTRTKEEGTKKNARCGVGPLAPLWFFLPISVWSGSILVRPLLLVQKNCSSVVLIVVSVVLQMISRSPFVIAWSSQGTAVTPQGCHALWV